MNDLFLDIKKQFDAKKRDLEFSPDLLSQLDDDSRKKIEKRIIELAKSGVYTSYKYLPYIKFFNIEQMITKRDISKLPDNDQIKIYAELFKATQNFSYVDSLTYISLKSFNAFSYLVSLYEEEKYFVYKDELKKKIMMIYALIDEENEAKYKMIIDNRVLNHNKDKINKEIVAGGFLGFVTGDALGVPVEFSSRETRKINPVSTMLGYKYYYVPEGTWSDDSSMTIATMASIIDKKDINYDDIMNRFCAWLVKADYTATNKVFDIGGTTRHAILSYQYGKTISTESGLTNERSNGNGSLMRMLPIAFYSYCKNLNEQEETEMINNLSGLTHAHEISKLGCKIYCDYIKEILKGRNKQQAYLSLTKKHYEEYYSSQSIEKYSRILNGKLDTLNENDISSSGYIISTLEASMWCTLTSDSYKEAVLKAVNLGEDTDTIGAITGGIAGCLYGINAIPNEWLNKLQKKEYLFNLTNQYYNTMNNEIIANLDSKIIEDDIEVMRR